MIDETADRVLGELELTRALPIQLTVVGTPAQRSKTSP